MSHIVQIQTEVRDPIAVRSACDRLKLPQPVQGVFELFAAEAAGLGVELPGWRYPVVCDVASGKVHYDNYGGRWGEQSRLDNFLQAYAVQKASIEARRKGHAVVEQPLEDGSIKLTVQIGGAA